MLDAWLIGLVAWVAAWGGVMLVHYFWLEKRWPGKVSGSSTPSAPRRLPVVNWAGMASLLAGIFATWLFMYGLIPVMQGPIAVALGGWDLSWLAGGLTSAGSLRRSRAAGAPQVPSAAADRRGRPAAAAPERARPSLPQLPHSLTDERTPA